MIAALQPPSTAAQHSRLVGRLVGRLSGAAGRRGVGGTKGAPRRTPQSGVARYFPTSLSPSLYLLTAGRGPCSRTPAGLPRLARETPLCFAHTGQGLAAKARLRGHAHRAPHAARGARYLTGTACVHLRAYTCILHARMRMPAVRATPPGNE